MQNRQPNIIFNKFLLSKSMLFCAMFVLISALFSCSNPVDSELSIVDKINNSKPYATIQIDLSITTPGSIITYNNTDGQKFTNAFAKGENLIIIVDENETEYYNLLTVKEVTIYKEYDVLYLGY